MKIRTWDTVQIMSGKEKDRGQKVAVLKVFPQTNKIIAKDINIVTRHIKKSGTNPGQIAKFEKAIDASNVMLICPFTDKPTRIGYTMIDEKGKNKKFRYSKKALSEKWGEPSKFIIK